MALIISYFFIYISFVEILCFESQFLWGTYKPHLLFALTEKTFNSKTLGFFYYKLKDKDFFLSNVRYKYKSNILTRFLEHNGFDYALQQIEDEKNYLFCEIKFLKEKFQTYEQQSWKFSISPTFQYAEDSEEAEFQSNNNKIAFVFYAKIKNFSTKDKIHFIRIREYQKDLYVLLELIERNTSDLTEKNIGYIKIEAYEDQCIETRSVIDLLHVDERNIWNIDNIYFQEVLQSEKFRNFERNPETEFVFEESNTNDSNLFYMTFFLQKNCKYIISYDSEQIPSFEENIFKDLENEKRDIFYRTFITKFLPEDFSLKNEDSLRQLKLSMYSFSNLVGGISYYQGNIMETNNIYQHSFKEVFTCTPSREKFPRGFLWDEGFHLLIICKYNEELCMKLIENWVNLMDIDGWIAREQIRNEETAFGLEARFLEQDNYEGNPPTLLFPILYLMKINIKNEKLKSFLRPLFGKLKLWFFWFLENQNNNENSDFFEASNIFSQKMSLRWHCKGDCHNGDFMGSGLDDFPRQIHGSLSKSHLDLHIWILFFAESLKDIADFLDFAEEKKEYQNIFNDLNDKLNKEFLDSADKIFKDVIIEKEELDNLSFNNNLGYISLFPLFFGLVKDESILKQYFKLILDNNQLWSEFGIRSLSKNNRFFGTGDNYWRGSIWIPINFLLLRGLKTFYQNFDEGKKIYISLRDNLIRNLVKNFEITGHIWENYNSITGTGQREPGFCGWSALITLIIKEEYF